MSSSSAPRSSFCADFRFDGRHVGRHLPSPKNRSDEHDGNGEAQERDEPLRDDDVAVAIHAQCVHRGIVDFVFEFDDVSFQVTESRQRAGNLGSSC